MVERAAGSRSGGYKIDLRGAAVDVARRMGIVSDVRRARIEMLGGAWVNGAGKRVASMRADFLEARDAHKRGDHARGAGSHSPRRDEGRRIRVRELDRARVRERRGPHGALRARRAPHLRSRGGCRRGALERALADVRRRVPIRRRSRRLLRDHLHGSQPAEPRSMGPLLLHSRKHHEPLDHDERAATRRPCSSSPRRR